MIPHVSAATAEMQRNSAAREGFNDAEEYIQHCLDDLH